MNYWAPQVAYAICMLLICAQTTPAAEAQPPDALRLAAARRALDALQIEQAATALEALGRSHPADGAVAFELGRLRLHQGRYAEAVEALSREIHGASSRELVAQAELLALARATQQATANFIEARSADGRYIVRYPPGESEVLGVYALETLRMADHALTLELGAHSPRPLRLEIYASARDLARVSPLTIEAIETSGTIALSKWDRLMLTSPRALLRGYAWRDTIAHELAHLLLTRASHNQAPVWLQEGVAKLLETSWREPVRTAALNPGERGLLQEALAHDALIPFSRLHPSIALLPSQSQTALAFAEVASFMAAVRRRSGPGGLRKLAAALARGVDARAAVAEATDMSFAALEQSWQQELRSAPPDGTRTPFRPRRFRHRAQDDSLNEVDDPAARRRVRLGDLLSRADHTRAAAVEYEAAAQAAPRDPAIAWRLARASLAAGDAARAVEVLSALRDRDPEYEPLHAWLAQALRAQGQAGAAAVEAIAAIGLNPFDPLPHCVLAESAATAADRAREGDYCRRLR